MAKLKQNILIGKEVSKKQEDEIRQSIDYHIQLLREKVLVLENHLEDKIFQTKLTDRGIVAERKQREKRSKIFKINSDKLGLNHPI